MPTWFYLYIKCTCYSEELYNSVSDWFFEKFCIKQIQIRFQFHWTWLEPVAAYCQLHWEIGMHWLMFNITSLTFYIHLLWYLLPCILMKQLFFQFKFLHITCLWFSSHKLKKSMRKWQENSPFSWMICISCQSDEKTLFSNLSKSTFLFLHQGYCECGILRQSPHQLQECAVGVGPQPGVAKSSSEKTDPTKPRHLARHCSRPAYSHQGMQMAVS